MGIQAKATSQPAVRNRNQLELRIYIDQDSRVSDREERKKNVCDTSWVPPGSCSILFICSSRLSCTSDAARWLSVGGDHCSGGSGGDQGRESRMRDRVPADLHSQTRERLQKCHQAGL